MSARCGHGGSLASAAAPDLADYHWGGVPPDLAACVVRAAHVLPVVRTATCLEPRGQATERYALDAMTYKPSAATDGRVAPTTELWTQRGHQPGDPGTLTSLFKTIGPLPYTTGWHVEDLAMAQSGATLASARSRQAPVKLWFFIPTTMGVAGKLIKARADEAKTSSLPGLLRSWLAVVAREKGTVVMQRCGAALEVHCCHPQPPHPLQSPQAPCHGFPPVSFPPLTPCPRAPLPSCLTPVRPARPALLGAGCPPWRCPAVPLPIDTSANHGLSLNPQVKSFVPHAVLTIFHPDGPQWAVLKGTNHFAANGSLRSAVRWVNAATGNAQLVCGGADAWNELANALRAPPLTSPGGRRHNASLRAKLRVWCHVERHAPNRLHELGFQRKTQNRLRHLARLLERGTPKR